ncbi:MAG: FAD-binding oxidoreductase, partial [Deltaproteobacteria bacterium]|nr:FAD-binding oxidoreductase [Deltaproteobacteria bacterium]
MDITRQLIKIVGEDRVSANAEERFIYSRDSGAQPPRSVDYVVMPKTVEEVRQVVLLANQEKIPVTPLGGGFTLSALVVPNQGGMVLDMKQMDRIIEVDETNRYALIEPGVSQAALQAY